MIKTIISPFQKFMKMEASSGIILLLAAAVALGWANSPWADAYHHLWELEFSLQLGDAELSKTLHHWINDGLMAIFFFLVGLEIKREVMEGELSTIRKATLPFLAALGGMALPVGLFLLAYQSGDGLKGWGIPMATDIAFSLGILALLGNRVSLGMNVFLTAFAIVDDIGAVLIIALFYSQGIQLAALAGGFAVLAVLLAANYLGLKSLWLYVLLSVVAWYFFLQSGIHATIAGVLAAFCIPSENKIALDTFLHQTRARIKKVRRRWDGEPEGYFLPEKDIEAIEAIKAKARAVEPPLQRIEEHLNGFVVYVIMPLFALANAGVHLGGGQGPLLTKLGISIAAALLIGKTLGIFGFSWTAVKVGIADLPEGTGWWQLLGMAMLGGVGFTMALFIANLAFEPSGLLDEAKIGILSGSLIAGLIGYLVILLKTRPADTVPEEGQKSLGKPSRQE